MQRIGSCIFSIRCCLLMELAFLLGGADAFYIHHDNCIPVLQADVKAVSRPFPALGLGLAYETMLLLLFVITTCW